LQGGPKILLSTDHELDLDLADDLNYHNANLRKHDTTLKVTDEGTFVKGETVTAIKTVGMDDNEEFLLSKNKQETQNKIAPPSVNVIKSVVKRDDPLQSLGDNTLTFLKGKNGNSIGLEPSITVNV
jgi:hypothetical protein